MSAARVGALWVLLVATGVARCLSQDYRLRVDTRVQAVAYRGVSFDSIPVGDTVAGPGGGLFTPDGYAVACNPNGFCTFYRAGGIVHAAPVTTTADLTVWGLGVPGLSVRAIGRATGDLSSGDNWAGTTSHLQLLEGYAQYAADWWTAQLGRQTVETRFGLSGFDGARVTLRDWHRGLEASGYAGWGLWQGSALPVTSPALNPLDEFRPPERTILAGAGGAWTTSRLDLRVIYQREVDPSTDYFVSERAGVDAVVRPYRGVILTGGADYDIAQGWWGSAEARLAYTVPTGRLSTSAGVRGYRPHFDLWTIWGAFSPVPYTAIDGTLDFRPVPKLQVRTQGEHYSYANSETATPLVSVESSGWRFSWGATYTLTKAWAVDGGYHAEFGPGASSRGFEGGVTYAARNLSITAHGATLDRPLEFRFDEASLNLFGLTADYRPMSRLRVQLDATRYAEDRKRPDAGAFSWDQLRVSSRVVLFFGGGSADGGGLPPAVRAMPERGSP
ncbi:MAG TPA: hypothetical protein VGV12_14425 [Gemmatimonadales bacterium]|nr:hypothetical protein [Gemmatimonadales bacterium]